MIYSAYGKGWKYTGDSDIWVLAAVEPPDSLGIGGLYTGQRQLPGLMIPSPGTATVHTSDADFFEPSPPQDGKNSQNTISEAY